MRKIILLEHVSLDGFAAGPAGEMEWIRINDEMFDHVGRLTDGSDTALYGRVTYDMMDSYWPTAADRPNASKHDTEHSVWYNKVEKVVLSRSMQGQQRDKTTFIGNDIHKRVSELKQQKGKDILMLGSPSAVHTLMQHNLIEEFWLFVNPIILGRGIPLFKDVKDALKLKLLKSETFAASGVVCLHYERSES